jgi:hypothetical protein
MSFMVKTSLPPREFVGIAELGQTRPTRRRFPWLGLIWADGGYTAWQVESRRGQDAGLAHGDCQTVGRHERFRRPAPAMGG